MGKYRVVAGQNIYDVALYLYGSIEGVVDLLINNPDLSFATTLTAGREPVYTDDFVIRADVVAYNGLHGIVPANGERHVYPKTFTSTSVLGLAKTESKSSFRNGSLTTTGSTKLFSSLFLWISAKKLLTTTRKP